MPNRPHLQNGSSESSRSRTVITGQRRTSTDSSDSWSGIFLIIPICGAQGSKLKLMLVIGKNEKRPHKE